MSFHLAIFVADEQYDVKSHLYLSVVLELFVADGHRTTIVRPGSPTEAVDAGILHVDATIVPHEVINCLPPTLPTQSQGLRHFQASAQ